MFPWIYCKISIIDFTSSIDPHPSWDFLFEITAKSLQTYDETSEDQANALH